MKPLSKKRAASEIDLARPQKHRRTTLLRADGQPSSPSETDGLRSRWKSVAVGIYEAGRDTAFYFFGSRDPPDMGRRRAPKRTANSGSTSESTSSSSPTHNETSGSLHAGFSQYPTFQAATSIARNSITPRPNGITNGLPVARTLFSPSPSFISDSSQRHTLNMSSYHNFSGVSSAPNQYNRDTPLRRPRRRKGSMGPPPLPILRNSQPFPSSLSSSAAPSPRPSPAPSDTAPYRLQRSSSVGSLRNPRLESRPHILESQHKANVLAEREKTRDTIIRESWKQHRKEGYRSDVKQFESFLEYRTLLEASINGPSSEHQMTNSFSLLDLRTLPPIQPSRMRRHSDIQSTPEHVRRALEKARATLNGPKPMVPFAPSLEQRRLRDRVKDEEIERRLRGSFQKALPSSLPLAEEQEINAILQKTGVISKFDREQVSGHDIQRLRPSQWLNDEIINFYGALLLGRADASNKENTKGKSKFLNVHYFSTFFWSKLEKDGYEKGRLAKWTKKLDIFVKDVILIPVNHNNIHWTGAAINFRQKRIESYDSMNMDRQLVYKRLRQYVDAEHRNKRKKPFDFTGWEDYTLEDTPQQENGFDCGVFTCQFLQSLSRGEQSFNFTQKDIPYLRRRMIWEVAHARLRDE